MKDAWEEFINYLSYIILLPVIVVGYEGYKQNSIVGVFIGSALLFVGMAVLNPALEIKDWKALNIGHLAGANAMFFFFIGFMYSWLWIVFTPIFIILSAYFYDQAGTVEKPKNDKARTKKGKGA